MTKTPCKVYYPREKGPDKREKEPDKVLTAKDQGELESLLRIGWKLEESK